MQLSDVPILSAFWARAWLLFSWALLVIALLAHLCTFVNHAAVPYLLWPGLIITFLIRVLVIQVPKWSAQARERDRARGLDVSEAEPQGPPELRSSRLLTVIFVLLLAYCMYLLFHQGPKGHPQVLGDECKIIRSAKMVFTGPRERCTEFITARMRLPSVVFVAVALRLAQVALCAWRASTARSTLPVSGPR
jgi:hypothetical protein